LAAYALRKQVPIAAEDNTALKKAFFLLYEEEIQSVKVVIWLGNTRFRDTRNPWLSQYLVLCHYLVPYYGIVGFQKSAKPTSSHSVVNR
jgi:hypothetical protein